MVQAVIKRSSRADTAADVWVSNVLFTSWFGRLIPYMPNPALSSQFPKIWRGEWENFCSVNLGGQQQSHRHRWPSQVCYSHLPSLISADAFLVGRGLGGIEKGRRRIFSWMSVSMWLRWSRGKLTRRWKLKFVKPKWIAISCKLFVALSPVLKHEWQAVFQNFEFEQAVCTHKYPTSP